MAMYYYNDVLLPEIPDVSATYPYLILVRSTSSGSIRLRASVAVPYYAGSYTRVDIPSGGSAIYKYDSETGEWGSPSIISKSTYFATSSWEVVWSNYDIIDNRDSSVWFAGSDPVSADSSHTHSYTETVTTEPTCTTEGVKTFTCECGDSYAEAIPATGHDYVNGICSRCGVIDPEGANWYIIQRTTLEAIGDQVRRLCNTEATMTPAVITSNLSGLNIDLEWYTSSLTVSSQEEV